MKPYIIIIAVLVFSGCRQQSNTALPKTTSEKKTNSKVEVAYKTKALLGEGAIWDAKTSQLYWIDIEGKKLHILDPKNHVDKVIKTPSKIGTVVPTENGDVLVALEDGVYQLNLKTEAITLFADMHKSLEGKRLNDGKCDPKGRFWVGSMHMEQKKGAANLYTINNSGLVDTKIDSVTISNGIVWTSDHKTMYYIDTPTSEIKAYDYDMKTGHISNQRVVVKISVALGYPDGMTIDEEDMLWVGMWNGNAVIRFNPKTGEILQKIEVPAHNITSCAFGGDDLETLYITSASIDMTEEEKKAYPLAGSVFKVKPEVKGVKSYLFKY